MADLRWRQRVGAGRIMAVLWSAFTAAYLYFFYLFRDASEIAEADLDGYLEVLLLGIPSVVLLAGVMWLRESDVAEEFRHGIVAWTVGVAVLFAVAMHTALFVIEAAFDPGERWLILLLSLGFGGSAGTVMGALGINSKQRERERNRSLRIARRTERERSKLEYLNQYLRHEVLNEANKIEGYATLLAREGDLDGTAREHLRVIRRSSGEIAEFIQSIRGILTITDHEPELTAVDVIPVLRSEMERITREHRSVAFELDGPESAPALAGEPVDRVFRNLIENAIEHNDGHVTVAISVDSGDEWVTVRVRDDGSGIPVEARDRLFDPPESGDHGYGLFLTKNLVEVYGGRLELGGTGPEGTEFVVRLRRDATARPSASVGENREHEPERERGDWLART